MEFSLLKRAYIYNALTEFIRREYSKRGFQEVVTPNIYNSRHRLTLGHWQHYSENTFSSEVEKELFAPKPMNSPGQCLMFDHWPRSWLEVPLWVANLEVMVVPVEPTCDEYAQKIRQQFRDAKFMVDIDVDPGCTLNRKIRNAQLAQYNFILVVGEKEKTSGTVNIHTRDNKVHGEHTVSETIEWLQQLVQSHNK
ncbi:hypothetical protein mRhiFer1_008255 [Rhinolophus ferrumequinum]|uniref:threonine--tRNA ligase n=1 Tax=Rhinolophus ferrumequinum TaxID=59479 RepID=A0A7J7VQM9_RHIFE|nr:hypothetical protein mRhiFer1_008255 [Rhinolophus ferrumequinum]